MNGQSKKTALVVGLAKSGLAAAEALVDRAVQVIATDLQTGPLMQDKAAKLRSMGVQVVLGEHPLSLLDQADYIVVSPGVPDTAPLMIEAKQRKLPILSEPELAYRFYPGPYLAVTGSNGKTTTTTWVGEALAAGQIPAVVAGNIGRPLTEAVSHLEPGSWVVAEMSSFQLDYTEQFHPPVCTVLNLSQDHLDRHGSFAAYMAAKARIFARQEPDDILILNADDKYSAELAATAGSRLIYFSRRQILNEGAWVEDDHIVLGWEGERTKICRTYEVGIPGAHNLENALATVCLARAAGVTPAAIARTLKSFAGVEHRCEKVAVLNEVLYVNDSKGTNPDASVKALEAFAEPTVLIAGGRDKGTNLDDLVLAIKRRCRAVILIGEATPKFRRVLTSSGFTAVLEAEVLPEAVKLAHDLACPGDIVLLSPACASFDMFSSYEHRGQVFKRAVEELGGDRA